MYESSLSELVVESGDDKFTLQGWSDTATPASLSADLIEAYFESDSKRYKFPLALRFYNSESRALGQS